MVVKKKCHHGGTFTCTDRYNPGKILNYVFVKLLAYIASQGHIFKPSLSKFSKVPDTRIHSLVPVYEENVFLAPQLNWPFCWWCVSLWFQDNLVPRVLSYPSLWMMRRREPWEQGWFQEGLKNTLVLKGYSQLWSHADLCNFLKCLPPPKSKYTSNTSTNLLQSCINPLSPNSDQHQISSNNINRQSRRKVKRINKMISKEKMIWSFIKFSQLILKGDIIEISLENLYVDIGA